MEAFFKSGPDSIPGSAASHSFRSSASMTPSAEAVLSVASTGSAVSTGVRFVHSAMYGNTSSRRTHR